MTESAHRLRHNATKCRDLASTAVTPAARDVLASLATEYEERALTLERSKTVHARPAFNWPLS